MSLLKDYYMHNSLWASEVFPQGAPTHWHLHPFPSKELPLPSLSLCGSRKPTNHTSGLGWWEGAAGLWAGSSCHADWLKDRPDSQQELTASYRLSLWLLGKRILLLFWSWTRRHAGQSSASILTSPEASTGAEEGWEIHRALLMSFDIKQNKTAKTNSAL